MSYSVPSVSYFPCLFFRQRGSDVCLRSAAIGDVLELSYQVRLQGTKGERGLVVDGAEVIAAEGQYSISALCYLSPTS